MGNCQNPKDQVRGVHKVQPLSLLVKHYTWSRDSHGLFDYESKNVSKGQLRTSSQISMFQSNIFNRGILVTLVRQKDSIKTYEYQPDRQQLLNEEPDSLELLQLHKKTNKYTIVSQNQNIENLPQKDDAEADVDGIQDNCVWIVVKSIPEKDGIIVNKIITNINKGYKMMESDYIKLGRVRFRIREIRDTSDVKEQNLLSRIVAENQIQFRKLENQSRHQTIEDINDDAKSKASNSAKTCRICLGEQEPGNPLIDPCNCQGSVRFLHIQCLQKWLGNKLAPKLTKFSVSFVWKKFECEICKSGFPNVVEVDGVKYETVEIPKPQVPYIALEIMGRDKNVSKGTHIISLAHKQSIKLGRGHDSDVRITDISVSRFHATIKFCNGSFYLEDNRSKFGTLLLMKNHQSLSSDEQSNLAVQVGRSVISFQIKKEWKVGSCCFTAHMAQEDADADEVQPIRQGDRDQIMMHRNNQQTIIMDMDQNQQEEEEKVDDVEDGNSFEGDLQEQQLQNQQQMPVQIPPVEDEVYENQPVALINEDVSNNVILNEENNQPEQEPQ